MNPITKSLIVTAFIMYVIFCNTTSSFCSQLLYSTPSAVPHCVDGYNKKELVLATLDVRKYKSIRVSIGPDFTSCGESVDVYQVGPGTIQHRLNHNSIYPMVANYNWNDRLYATPGETITIVIHQDATLLNPYNCGGCTHEVLVYGDY